MPETKILPFPGTYEGRYGAGMPGVDAGVGHLACRGGRGLVAYVDVATLDEESLLALVSENQVKAFVDARPCPVFAKPRFRHKEVVFYLFHRRIPYIEMAMLSIWPASERRLGTFMRSETYSALEDGLGRGLTVCVYDDDAREDGWLEETRRMIRHSRGYVAELLPTALSGQS